MRTIAWVTPMSFLDTDIYLMPYLQEYFYVEWYITKPASRKLEYKERVEQIRKLPNINIKIVDFYSTIGLSAFLQEFRLLKSVRNADLVYKPSSWPYALPLMALLLRRKGTIVPVHNVHTPKGARMYYLAKLFTEISVRYFKNFITFSKSQKELLEDVNCHANILQASFFLKDYGRPTTRRESEILTFLNFGNIMRYKRIDVLIEAAQKAYKMTQKKFRVIIAGHCKNWDDYQKKIEYPELFDIRIGRVEDKEIPNLFEESDYFVAPYQDIAQSGSLIVAINYNKPIIASDLEAFRDYVTDNVDGYLIKPADIESLANCMISIINNGNAQYAKLVESQKKMIESKFKDEVISSKYVHFLNSLL